MWKNQQQGRWGNNFAGRMAPAGASGFSLTKDLKHEKMAKGVANNIVNVHNSVNNPSAVTTENYNKVGYSYTSGTSQPAPNAANNFNRVPYKYTNISSNPNPSSITDAINKLLPIVNTGVISQSATNNEYLSVRSTRTTGSNQLSLAGKSGDFNPDSGNHRVKSQSEMIPDRGLGAMFSKSSNLMPKQQPVSSGDKEPTAEPDTWNCIKCRYYNFGNRAKCNKCGIDKSIGDGSKSKNDKNTGAPVNTWGNWDCVKCQYHNFGRRNKCKRCSETRTDSSKNTDKGDKSKDTVLGGNVNIGVGRSLLAVADSKKDNKNTTKNGVREEENNEASKLPNEWRCIKCQSSNYNKRTTCRKCQGLRSNCDSGIPNKQEAPKSKSLDDWVCVKCRNTNFKHRTQCNRCHSNRSDFDGGNVGRDGAGYGRQPKGGARITNLSNDQITTALKAIEAIEGMQGQNNNPNRDKNNIPLDRFMAGNNNMQQNMSTDQLPDLVRKIAAEEIANKIMEGTVPISNNPLSMSFDDRVPDQVRKFAAEDIATKIIEGRNLGDEVLTHAQQQAIDKMRMMAAEEIANKILQGGGNLNMDMGSLMNMAADTNNMLMNTNIMQPVSLMSPANIIQPVQSGIIQPVIGPNSSIMALVLPPGDNPAMNIIPANNMGMNIIPPSNNLMLNNIPAENERINANDVFNSGADYYSNYRKAQNTHAEKKKTIQPVKEHPLPPKRMRPPRKTWRPPRKMREQMRDEVADKKEKSPVLDTSQKKSTVGKRALLWAQGRAQKNLEGVSVKHVTAVKPGKGKGKGKERMTTTKTTTTGNTPAAKQSGNTPSTSTKKNDNTPDSAKNETVLKTSTKGKGDVIDLISDSDEDIIDVTDEKLNGKADKGKLPAHKSVPTDESNDSKTEKEKDKDKEKEKEKETLVNTTAAEKCNISNPLFSIDDPDEPMYTVVDKISDDDDDGLDKISDDDDNGADKISDDNDDGVDKISEDDDDGMYTFEDDENASEPTQKIHTWSDTSDFGMLGLLPQVPRAEYGDNTDLVEFSEKEKLEREKERVRSQNQARRRRKRKMSEKELKETLSDMGLLRETTWRAKDQERGLKNPHA